MGVQVLDADLPLLGIFDKSMGVEKTNNKSGYRRNYCYVLPRYCYCVTLIGGYINTHTPSYFLNILVSVWL